MEYLIGSVEDWQALPDQVMIGATIRLTADLVISSPLKVVEIQEGAVLDGQGHALQFGMVPQPMVKLMGGEISNLKLVGNGQVLGFRQTPLVIYQSGQYGTLTRIHASGFQMNGSSIQTSCMLPRNFGRPDFQSLVQQCYAEMANLGLEYHASQNPSNCALMCSDNPINIRFEACRIGGPDGAPMMLAKHNQNCAGLISSCSVPSNILVLRCFAHVSSQHGMASGALLGHMCNCNVIMRKCGVRSQDNTYRAPMVRYLGWQNAARSRLVMKDCYCVSTIDPEAPVTEHEALVGELYYHGEGGSTAVTFKDCFTSADRLFCGMGGAQRDQIQVKIENCHTRSPPGVVVISAEGHDVKTSLEEMSLGEEWLADAVPRLVTFQQGNWDPAAYSSVMDCPRLNVFDGASDGGASGGGEA